MPSGRSGKSGPRGKVTTSPGRLRLECATLASIIKSAYIEFATGQDWPVDATTGRQIPLVSHRRSNEALEHGPSWIDSSQYTINAKAESATSTAMMRGPMMQQLLEERFKLRIHRESKSVPVFELRVAKGGPKLQRAREGSCVIIDRSHPPVGPTQRVCGGVSGDYIYGTSMSNLSRQLSAVLDRDVIDKTGIVGTFDIRLQGTALDTPGPDTDGKPVPRSIAGTGLGARLEASLPRLGLKLESADGAGEFIVIDHIERPDEN